MQGLDKFIMQNGRLPKPANEDDANEVLELVHWVNRHSSQNSKVDEIDETLVKTLSKSSKGDITPMACIIGGVVGQEVIKVMRIRTLVLSIRRRI